MHDQLAVLAPVMMALTAATPIFKVCVYVCVFEWRACTSSNHVEEGGDIGTFFPSFPPVVARTRRAGLASLTPLVVHTLKLPTNPTYLPTYPPTLPTLPTYRTYPPSTRTPQGRLADTDARWDTIAGAVDDRTPAERGLLGDDPEVGMVGWWKRND